MRFPQMYQIICDDVMGIGSVEHNRRTNTDIRVIPYGASFALDLRDHGLPTCGLRMTRPLHSAAETAWCFMGDRDLTWLNQYTKVWNRFAEQDKKTGKYHLNEAYGARWRDGIDQVEAAVMRLQDDPTDRRIVVTAWNPTEDLGSQGQKTVPCPISFTLSIVDDLLCSMLVIRSSDLWFGLPYDVMRHILVMAAFATTLGIGLGFARFALAHPHVYRPQWPLMTEMLRQTPICPRVELPRWTIDEIIASPDAYVSEFERKLGRIPTENWPEYDPKSEVVQ